jgi:hypothetical protein
MTAVKPYQDIRVNGRVLVVTGAEVFVIEGGPELEVWDRA